MKLNKEISKIDDVDELREVKREIDKKIRDITNKENRIECGRVKLDRETQYKREWRVSIRREADYHRTHQKQWWTSVIRSAEKDKAIAQIKPLISDLQNLLLALEEEK